MQYIPNGPDIPNTLVQAHEEGRVVFFCGAGISYPAGLPGFEGLVEKIYEINGTNPTAVEQEAIDQKRFDVALDLLEERLPNQRSDVLQALTKTLEPDLGKPSATDTHVALLQLSQCRKGTLRLVTTNFDRMFHAAAERAEHSFHAYAAPMLPIPKNSRWDGLVYLHGLLPHDANDPALNNLVVTSGDFGLAYLTERWAARFVSELFRNYVVCFIGYSINDPVLHYMMDALAADRRRGETLPKAWALAECTPGQTAHAVEEWKAKHVTPILYEVPAGSHDHSGLYETLQAWAETYRNGVQGKEAIVAKYARSTPQDSTLQEDFVGQMLWALSDETGLPAKHFAEFNPVPPLEWLLEAISEPRYGYDDLPSFSITNRTGFDKKVAYSLIRRPAHSSHAPFMSLACAGSSETRLDNRLASLGRWLTRHLNDPRLIVWVAEQGGQLNSQWAWMIEREIERFEKLEEGDNTEELRHIRADAPNAIPSPLMRRLWHYALSNRLASPRSSSNFYHWKRDLKKNGLTTALRLQLRELLSPKLRLKRRLGWASGAEESGTSDQPTHMRQLVDWEIVLTADHVHHALKRSSSEVWPTTLPHLLEDLELMLRDALDIRRDMGAADDEHDRSYWDLPSIEPHWQNRGFRDWVSLIELLRDAWLEVLKANTADAARIANAWFKRPYPTFKRLALFAASKDNCIAPEQWVDWLLTDDAQWLWSIDSHREVMRLLASQGQQVQSDIQQRLETAILAGPPLNKYPDDSEADKRQYHHDSGVWIRLEKLSESGLELSDIARQTLNDLKSQHPHFKPKPHQREEFLQWMSGTGDPDYEANKDVDIAPCKRKDLVPWLKQPVPDQRLFHDDTWKDVCRHHMLNALYALCDLSRENIWPTERWREALQAWSEKGIVQRSWRHAAPLVQKIPDDELQELIHSVSWWMEAVSKSPRYHKNILLKLCQRILALPLDADSSIKDGDGEPLNQAVTEAINHPVGHVTQVLINLWFAQSPGDNDELPDEIEALFTQLCDVEEARYRHGRVLLGSRLVTLFRVDRSWTEQHLLPLFRWNNPHEARALWQGFLWSPRLYQPLLDVFKASFLETAHHYGELGEFGQQYAALLTHAALDSIEGYSEDDFRSAFEELPQNGLEETAQTLSQILESAGKQSEESWEHRIRPFWHDIWPKNRELATPSMAESLARLTLAAGTAFPDALNLLHGWLKPLEHPSWIMHLLGESDLCEKYPSQTLQLLGYIINDQTQWICAELKSCLERIVRTEPKLTANPAYQRLDGYVRRLGC